jgi:hypothetical protein
MPQLDFFNILSQLEYTIIFFLFFYLFVVFFVVPTILSIFQIRAFYISFSTQIFNSFLETLPISYILAYEIFSDLEFSFSEVSLEEYNLETFNSALILIFLEEFLKNDEISLTF